MGIASVPTVVYGCVMQDLPKPVNGSDLANARIAVGVTQQALADALGIHRTRLYSWERATPLDGIRAARYQAALVQLVKAKVAA